MKSTSLKRLSLVLCSTLLLTAVPSQVWAGSVPVVETDSSITGQGGGFANDAIADFALSRQISAALIESLQTITRPGQVEVGGQTLTLTTEEIQAFNTILAGGPDAEAAANFLVQQISADIGVDLEMALIAASGSNLDIVVNNFNTLVNSLNRTQLLGAFQSASLQAILQALQAAVRASREPEELLDGGESISILFLLKLL